MGFQGVGNVRFIGWSWRSKVTLGGAVLSEFSPGSFVEEHHVLVDGLAADVQLIGGEVRIGVADRQATQDR